MFRELAAILLVLLATIDIRSAVMHPPFQKQTQPPPDPRTLPFNPCRSPQKIGPQSKKRITKNLVAVMSACALKVATYIHKSWGRPKDIRIFIPKAGNLLCMVTRVTYGYYVNPDGRLPPALAQNGSRVFAMILGLIKAGLIDGSADNVMCAHAGKPVRTVCYDKQRIWQTIRLATPCAREALNGSVLENVDGSLFLLFSMINSLTNSGFISYIGG